MAFKNFIRIDVSKLTFGLTLFQFKKKPEHWCIENEPEAIKQFLDELLLRRVVKIGNTVFGMEYTGIYINKLLGILYKKNANVVVDSPLHIKYPMEIFRGKTDKVDSGRIVHFGKTNRPVSGQADCQFDCRAEAKLTCS